MSDVEQDPEADLNHQGDMPSTNEEINTVNDEIFEGPSKLSALSAKSGDSSKETTPNCDGLTISTPVEKSDGLTEPPVDATINDDEEEEAGEIYSPKVSEGEEEEENKFAVECELDFEDEGADIEAAEPSTKKAKNKEVSGEKDGSDDDGECSDEVDEDVEEGELKDEIPNPLDTNASVSSKPNAPTKTVCRFYNRGICFYGINCRFLHVNFLKTGNYSMFAPAHKEFADGYDPVGGMAHGMMNHRPPGFAPSRMGPDFPPQAPSAQPALESAWVRALTEAKELVKKANKRKIEEPDFDEKRLNLSLVVNEKNLPEEENENHYKKRRRENLTFAEREFDDDIYDDGYEPRPHWREAHFEPMEVHHEKEFRRDRGRTDRKRDKFPKSPDRRDRFREDRSQQVRPKSRGDDYFDPWRRSKSPKGNLRRTRSRSGSYSSGSSYSNSTRSSRSSSSYSSSSRSPRRKRTPSPSDLNPSFTSPKLGPNKFSTMKNKPGGRPSSRSVSRTPSRSRSRSFSRSISMDSVSSASSHSGSSHSEPRHHTSILRKPTAVGGKSDPAIVAASNPPATSLPTAYSTPPVCKIEKDAPKPEPRIMDEDERDPLEEHFLTPGPVDVPFSSLQHLLPSNDKAKEPFKATPHKQQIKLTLLNKNTKLNNFSKKDLEVNKKQNEEPSKPVGYNSGAKGPVSPPVTARPTPVLVPKKSASSRRDELLKQLKAVEDAIARKRSKCD